MSYSKRQKWVHPLQFHLNVKLYKMYNCIILSWQVEYFLLWTTKHFKDYIEKTDLKAETQFIKCEYSFDHWLTS